MNVHKDMGRGIERKGEKSDIDQMKKCCSPTKRTQNRLERNFKISKLNKGISAHRNEIKITKKRQ